MFVHSLLIIVIAVICRHGVGGGDDDSLLQQIRLQLIHAFLALAPEAVQ